MNVADFLCWLGYQLFREATLDKTWSCVQSAPTCVSAGSLWRTSTMASSVCSTIYIVKTEHTKMSVIQHLCHKNHIKPRVSPSNGVGFSAPNFLVAPLAWILLQACQPFPRPRHRLGPSCWADDFCLTRTIVSGAKQGWFVWKNEVDQNRRFEVLSKLWVGSATLVFGKCTKHCLAVAPQEKSDTYNCDIKSWFTQSCVHARGEISDTTSDTLARPICSKSSWRPRLDPSSCPFLFLSSSGIRGAASSSFLFLSHFPLPFLFLSSFLPLCFRFLSSSSFLLVLDLFFLSFSSLFLFLLSLYSLPFLFLSHCFPLPFLTQICSSILISTTPRWAPP